MKLLLMQNVEPSAPFNALLIRSGRLIALARIKDAQIVSLYRLNQSKTLVYEVQSRWIEFTPLPDGRAIRAELRVRSVWDVVA